MDLLLWRWSTAAQFLSALIVAAFFVALSRSSRRAEVRWWELAWFANVLALAVTVFYWFAQPRANVGWLLGAYMAAKLGFVLWLIRGAWAVGRPGTEPLSQRTILTAAMAYGFVGGLFIPSIAVLGVVQHLAMGLLLVGGALAMGGAWHHVTWLATGLGVRGALALAEAGAYWVDLDAGGLFSADLRQQAGWFLSLTSSLDAGMEWFIALGCVLAVSERSQRELAVANRYLREAQEHLRRLADRDPLTALENRRALPEVFRTVQPEGATVLFLDLDGFKQINDLYGHGVGDDCLVRFARAVRESFRPTDAVIRYGGDEFLVIAPGLDRAAAMERVNELRTRLAAEPEPHIHFTCGVAELDADGSPEATLQEADKAMYRLKQRA
ncbi:MAG: GGDEF domain-containing protein [Acidobacteria bacterium]|nr:GGDEF domain-containing protein [Acidobacteriota bacterium]